MFTLSKDKRIVLDTFGNEVGFFDNGKFCQVLRTKGEKPRLCSPFYKDGLTPIQLEQVSEAIQRATTARPDSRRSRANQAADF